MIKPGYRTSEFWFTLVSFIFSGLYLVGLVGENSQKEELITIVSHAVESIILISGQGLIFYRYIKGRTEIKKTINEPKPKPKPKSKPKNAKRNTKTRVRKSDSGN